MAVQAKALTVAHVMKTEQSCCDDACVQDVSDGQRAKSGILDPPDQNVGRASVGFFNWRQDCLHAGQEEACFTCRCAALQFVRNELGGGLVVRAWSWFRDTWTSESPTSLQVHIEWRAVHRPSKFF